MSPNKGSSIISADKVTSFDVWKPPEVTGQSVNSDQIDARKSAKGSSTVKTPVTAQEFEEIRKAAYQEGLEKGLENGRKEAQIEQQNITDSLNTILNQCHKLASNFDEKVCEDLVTMTISIAKQVIRRELSVNPEQIMGVIRESINCLPPSTEKLVLKLHPEDATLVREIYQLNEELERSWKIFEDPGMQRGGCIINSESSVINADLDNRIATIVTKLLGGERGDD
ncbi:MAG: flagellar assembly protein FliH [Gammaproteobacteria bacterium]|nr:flagellar assembly protein FliH [Gammaproteobacteria bacterium]